MNAPDKTALAVTYADVAPLRSGSPATRTERR